MPKSFPASRDSASTSSGGSVTRAGPRVEAALRHRAGLVLALARLRGHRRLLRGGWGCGVFRNDPEMVADAFGAWLSSKTFAGDSDDVAFAVFDRSDGRQVHAAFERRFETQPANVRVEPV